MSEVEIASAEGADDDKRRIETTRQLLNAEVIRLTRSSRKHAVGELLGSLIAAREQGISFEDLAKIFEKGGLSLSPVTLRTYYFELKTRSELKQAAEKHASQVREAKKLYDQILLDRNSEHAKEMALAHLRSEEPVLFNAFAQVGNGATMPLKEGRQPPSAKATSAASSSRSRPRLVKAQPKSGPSTSPPSAPFWAQQGQEAPNAASAPPRAQAPPAAEGMRSIDQLASASELTEERTALEEDLVADASGFVTYKSGRPFVGFLSKKQIHLLRTVGRIIKQTDGRSSKDFVAMPKKL